MAALQKLSLLASLFRSSFFFLSLSSSRFLFLFFLSSLYFLSSLFLFFSFHPFLSFLFSFSSSSFFLFSFLFSLFLFSFYLFLLFFFSFSSFSFFLFFFFFSSLHLSIFSYFSFHSRFLFGVSTVHSQYFHELSHARRTFFMPVYFGELRTCVTARRWSALLVFFLFYTTCAFADSRTMRGSLLVRAIFRLSMGVCAYFGMSILSSFLFFYTSSFFQSSSPPIQLSAYIPTNSHSF